MITFRFEDGLKGCFGSIFGPTEAELKLGFNFKEQDLAFRCASSRKEL
jgi:hypothetical protein